MIPVLRMVPVKTTIQRLNLVEMLKYCQEYAKFVFVFILIIVIIVLNFCFVFCFVFVFHFYFYLIVLFRGKDEALLKKVERIRDNVAFLEKVPFFFLLPTFFIFLPLFLFFLFLTN